MSRYMYNGPYDAVEVEGRVLTRGEEFDANDDAYIEDLRRRGFHLFVPVQGGSEPSVEAESADAPAEEPSGELPADADAPPPVEEEVPPPA